MILYVFADLISVIGVALCLLLLVLDIGWDSLLSPYFLLTLTLLDWSLID